MKHTLVGAAWSLLLAASLVLAGCDVSVRSGERGGETITGSGNKTTKTFDLTDFAQIELSSAFSASVTQGAAFSVSVTADDNIMPHIKVVKSGARLTISLDGQRRLGTRLLEAKITLPKLTSLKVSGASRAEVSGFKSADSLELEALGASRIAGSIDAGDIRADVEGASAITLNGSGKNLHIEVSGASTANLGDFKASDCVVEVSGASRATIFCSGKLTGEASGASRIEYGGNPTSTNVTTSGASSIRVR